MLAATCEKISRLSYTIPPCPLPCGVPAVHRGRVTPSLDSESPTRRSGAGSRPPWRPRPRRRSRAAHRPQHPSRRRKLEPRATAADAPLSCRRSRGPVILEPSVPPPTTAPPKGPPTFFPATAEPPLPSPRRRRPSHSPPPPPPTRPIASSVGPPAPGDAASASAHPAPPPPPSTPSPQSAVPAQRPPSCLEPARPIRVAAAEGGGSGGGGCDALLRVIGDAFALLSPPPRQTSMPSPAAPAPADDAGRLRVAGPAGQNAGGRWREHPRPNLICMRGQGSAGRGKRGRAPGGGGL